MSDFPKKTKFYLHGDDDSNYDDGLTLGLSKEAIMKNFRGTGYEVEFDLLVNEDGTNVCTHINGVELKEPMSI